MFQVIAAIVIAGAFGVAALALADTNTRLQKLTVSCKLMNFNKLSQQFRFQDQVNADKATTNTRLSNVCAFSNSIAGISQTTFGAVGQQLAAGDVAVIRSINDLNPITCS